VAALTTLATINTSDAYDPTVLIADANGDLFGATAFGGAVFELAKTASGYASTPTILAKLIPGGGYQPVGGLIADTNGDLIGTSEYGDTLFEIARTASGYAGTTTTLISNSGLYAPVGGLIADANGDLFGVTEFGGGNGAGAVFEVANTASGYASTPTILLSFNGTDGASPLAGLIADANGDLFGTTTAGGAGGDGTVFEIANTANGYASTPTILAGFNGSDGADPVGGLIEDANGDLFGTTGSGGASNDGTVFEIAKTTSGGYASTPTTLVSFDGSNGSDPDTGLIADASGNLFGATGAGTVFEVTNTGYAVACFCHGTKILTARGDVAVEDLAIGDPLVTVSGEARPIRWIGRRHIDLTVAANHAAVQPVRVAAHAFGPGRPHHDLWVSPDHAVFVEGVLIPIKYLRSGRTIMQETRDEVTYWHVELARHDVIFAEGLPCESYLDTGNRSGFINGSAVVQMHPSFAPGEGSEAMWEAAGYAPLRIAGEAVDRAVARLSRRAAELGNASPSKPRQRPGLLPATTADLADLLQPEWYLATNPDVAASGVDARTHYVEWAGRREGRRPCPEVDLVRALGLIDPVNVAIVMPDVITAGLDPVEHFCAVGWTEQRPPNPYFDTGWYLDTHDVPAGMNPLLHYLLLGENQGLPPSRHFDPAWYRERYALKHTASPLAHYLMHRRTQRFSPLPSFDVSAYRQMHAATLLPERDPYAHFLAIGQFDPGKIVFAAESMAA
jgi:uncharacterized repeat protein (TIGR03803 family)